MENDEQDQAAVQRPFGAALHAYHSDWCMALHLVLTEQPVPVELVRRIVDVPAGTPALIAEVVARAQASATPLA